MRLNFRAGHLCILRKVTVQELNFEGLLLQHLSTLIVQQVTMHLLLHHCISIQIYTKSEFKTDFYEIFWKKVHLFLYRALMNQCLACVVNIVEISCCIYTLRKSMSNLLCNVKIWRKFLGKNGLEKVRPKFYLMYWAGANGSSSRLLNHLMPLFSFYTLLKSSKNPPANSGRPMYSEGFFDVFRRVWKENSGMKLVNGTF